MVSVSSIQSSQVDPRQRQCGEKAGLLIGVLVRAYTSERAKVDVIATIVNTRRRCIVDASTTFHENHITPCQGPNHGNPPPPLPSLTTTLAYWSLLECGIVMDHDPRAYPIPFSHSQLQAPRVRLSAPDYKRPPSAHKPATKLHHPPPPSPPILNLN